MTSKSSTSTPRSTDADDARLITRVGLGDRRALESIYQKTSGKLLAAILRIVADRAEAEDALQEVFIKIWNRAKEYRHARGSPMAWIMTIARNEAIDRVRRRVRTGVPTPLDPDELVGTQPQPAAHAESEAAIEHLRQCLQALDKIQRSSIRLAFFEGLSHGELAARVAEPLGTVKARIRRGIQSLRNCLERGSGRAA